MGLASDKPVRVDDTAFIATSFPGFVEMMRRIGGDLA
jgi:3-phosphoshikimate 1-carboxyvinyltransferase